MSKADVLLRRHLHYPPVAWLLADSAFTSFMHTSQKAGKNQDMAPLPSSASAKMNCFLLA